MLALWEYFWDDTDWTGGPPAPSPAPAPVPSGGGGGHKKRRNQEYQPLPSDFWDVRERYLRRFVEPLAKDTPRPTPAPVKTTVAEIIPDDGPLLLMQQALAAALQRARAAQTDAELRDATKRAYALALDISNFHQQYYNRAIGILLLDLF